MQKSREEEGEEGREDITAAIAAISETTEFINSTKKDRDTKLDLLSVAQKITQHGKDPLVILLSFFYYYYFYLLHLFLIII